jgi:hypothetical protein
LAVVFIVRRGVRNTFGEGFHKRDAETPNVGICSVGQHINTLGRKVGVSSNLRAEDQ